MKRSRLLVRLDAQIEACKDPVAKVCLRVERACYLARRAQFDEVRDTLLELRQRNNPNPNLMVSVWLSLAEGLLIHFSNMGDLAKDKILRAYALSAAAGLTQLNALCAAWLAHMEYLTVDMVGMTRHVGQALTAASHDNHAALSRANLVVAHAFHLAGRLDLARPWYTRAHGHAAAEGDDSTVSALMHNMAWLRAANLRQEVLCGKSLSPNGEYALAGVESTLQFDRMFGGTTLHALAPVLRAQILVVDGQFAEALKDYDEHLSTAVEQGMQRLHANLLADKAWCRLNLGQTQAARNDAEAAEAHVDLQGQFDDRAPAHSRLSQVFLSLGDIDASNRHADLAAEAWAGHERLQQETLELLSTLPKSSIDNPA